MQMSRRTIPPALLAMALLAGGCVYKMDITQGNHVDAQTIARIEPGMSRSQVRFLLGTPIVADPFHADRWDYVYYFRNGRNGTTERRRYEVYFDGDVVERVVEAES